MECHSLFIIDRMVLQRATRALRFVHFMYGVDDTIALDACPLSHVPACRARGHQHRRVAMCMLRRRARGGQSCGVAAPRSARASSLELLMTNPSRHAILSHNEHTGSPLTRSNGWISATPPWRGVFFRGFVRSEKSARRPSETSRNKSAYYVAHNAGRPSAGILAEQATQQNNSSCKCRARYLRHNRERIEADGRHIGLGSACS